MILRSNPQTQQARLPRWLRWLPVAVFAALWEALPRLGVFDRMFLPTFSEVLGTLWVLLVSGALLEHVLTSLLRVLAGFAVAIAIGVFVGAMLGQAEATWRKAFDPFLRVLSQLNPFSLLPVFLLIFGSGEAVKIAALAWVATWPVLFFTTVGLVNADPLLLKTARSFGADPNTILFKVSLPAAIPSIFVGVRIAAGLVFFVLVGAEMLGTNAGLGWLVHNSGMNYQIKGIYAGALAVVLIGFAFSRLLLSLEARIIAVFSKHEKVGEPPLASGKLSAKEGSHSGNIFGFSCVPTAAQRSRWSGAGNVRLHRREAS